MERTWTYSRAFFLTWGLVLVVVNVLVLRFGSDGTEVGWSTWALVLFVGLTLIGLGVSIVSILARDEILEQWARYLRGEQVINVGWWILRIVAAPMYWLGKLLGRLWHLEDRT